MLLRFADKLPSLAVGRVSSAQNGVLLETSGYPRFTIQPLDFLAKRMPRDSTGHLAKLRQEIREVFV